VLLRFLKKLKIELPYDPLILFLGIYPKEYVYHIMKFYSAIRKNATTWFEGK
jgi:hypothetical protein